MAVPSQGTVAVGDKITASLWNDDVRDAVNFLISPPRVKVYKTANQSIGSSGWACLTWDAEAFDSDTMHSNTTANSRITFTTAGTYLITFNAMWANNSTGLRNHTIEKNGNTTQGNGTAIIEPFAIAPVAATHSGANISVIASFVAGDWIQAFVWQNSGGALNLSGVSESHSTLSANWIAS
jgi:hypothetical protein